ncbi:magnesium-transporting ATPase (P-type) [Microbacterium natoriense]|uniref:Magnesium-transporting ATPase (P-type) n=1 Tax=Microbacterium natoriense TaxID=284570 RepID=A0AAW8F135_9MICO|nr:hypothetical protein [Microbacterium natoriense]MDQ0649511.1 magnesium-transporting ATPase (P-type) [Microbacterium natoriense]
MVDREARRQLVIVLTTAGAIVVGLGALLTWGILDVKSDRLAAGLTNVATIGGIVSGLSLSGTAVLALSGRYTSRVLGKYGSVIRFVLFGGFTVLVAASLLCAVSVLWADQIWTRFVLGFTIPLMLMTLIATALLINSAFAWTETTVTTRTPDPFSKNKLSSPRRSAGKEDQP